ncbi:hypothetical protein [Streptomyces bohaiensis]|uniref:Uncharacterized protein n=1 Tax=Streptomyces bohaiensis TaxID=1431344 RepID=A0ABX1C3W9_9ACTN|nr:hypothetical protein [Streptomyces bohaiensis]NJQ13538.1 hypothetical protein [Streptomyces bohaiensis]
MPAAPAHMLTSRDLEILAWIGTWRAVTTSQVMREFNRRDGWRRREVYDRRLRALLALGLIRHARPLADRPRITWLTRAGHRAAGLEGAVAEPSTAELIHDLEVVELALHLAERQPDHELITEQEIRRSEPHPSAGPAAALRAMEASAGRGTGGRGYPDLASVAAKDSGEQVWVHEMERHRKSRARWLNIMLSYVYADHIHGCVYWAWPGITESVQAAAEETNRSAVAAGLTPAIVVRTWEPRL